MSKRHPTGARPAGELLICRSSLLEIACDAILIPSDVRGKVRAPWRDFLASRGVPLRGDFCVNVPGTLARDRVWKLDGQSVGDSEPVLWLGDVARETPREVAQTAARFVKKAAATRGSRFGNRGGVPLVAVPFVGTRGGGYEESPGPVAAELIPHLERAAAAAHVDVVLVLQRPDAFGAAQHARDQDPHVTALGRDLCDEADRLALAASRGEIVLFIGAGMSSAAGAPSWSELVAFLECKARLTPFTGSQSERLPQRAELAVRALNRTKGGSRPVIEGKVDTPRYGVGTALLATLGTREVVTTNYDRHFERASADARISRAVFPWDLPADGRPWLLKLHGCSKRGQIVLTRSDYLRFGHQRSALRGIVQAMLATRHMVFVGFGLDDPNFDQIVHDLRDALPLKSARARKRKQLGTAIVFEPEPALEALWSDEIKVLGVPCSDGARQVELFLDRIAFRMGASPAHFLAPGYETTIQGDADARLRELLDAIVNASRLDPAIKRSTAWRAVEDLLINFGAPIKPTAARRKPSPRGGSASVRSDAPSATPAPPEGHVSAEQVLGHTNTVSSL